MDEFQPVPPQALAKNILNPRGLTPIVPPQSSLKQAGAIAKGNWAKTNTAALSIRQRPALISTNTSRLVETRKARLPCFQLAHHSPNQEFLGRRDVFGQIDDYLLPRVANDDNVSTRSFALCGMGGIGKTSLAIEYAFSRRCKFGAVFWIEAAGVSQLATDFGRISTHLGLELIEEAIDLESSKEFTKAWLNKPRSHEYLNSPNMENDSWLLIFDNADNIDIIADYIPYNGHGSVLVTSRDPFAKTHFFSGGAGIDMEPLLAQEAATLLRNLVSPVENASDDSNDNDERIASLEMAERLDGLPLAMSQIAGFIRRRQISIREFAELYNNDIRYAEFHDVSNPSQERRYGSTLATAFRLSELPNDASRLLQLLAFLNPDRIREDIFIRSGSQLAGQSSAASWEPRKFEKARYDLTQSSMIKRSILKREICIHRVIQSEVRAHMDEADRYAAFSEVVNLLCARWPPGDHCSQVTERWAICEDLLPHLERLYHLYLEHPEWVQYEVEQALPTLMNEVAV